METKNLSLRMRLRLQAEGTTGPEMAVMVTSGDLLQLLDERAPLSGLDFTPDAQHSVADMANVGYQLLQEIQAYRPGYVYSVTPAEIVGDLCEQLGNTAGTAPQVAAPADEREGFEAAIRSSKRFRDNTPLNFIRLNGKFDRYTDPDTDTMWLGFALGARLHNRAASPEVAAPELEEFWAVIAPGAGEGVLFEEPADAHWTQSGKGRGEWAARPVIGENFRECYGDTELKLVRVRVVVADHAAQAAAGQSQGAPA